MRFEKLNCQPGRSEYLITPDGGFRESDWLCLDLLARGGNDTVIRLAFSETADSQPLIRINQYLIPGIRATLPFPVSESAFRLDKNFLVPRSALRKGTIGGIPTDKSKIGAIKLTVSSSDPGEVELYSVGSSKTCPESPLAGEKLVDRFGQGISGQTSDRVKSEEELVDSLRSEYEKAEESPASYPDGWSEWGGFTGKKFAASGFFRLEKENGRWWLVDPDGNAFFSNGVCYGERAGVFALTDDYSPLCEWLPDGEEFAECWCDGSNIPQYVVRNGLAEAKERKLFNFARANLIRAFGKDWHRAFTVITASRLRRMGFNTIGVGTNDYFDERTDEFLKEAKIPYIVTFRDFPLTTERIFRDFPDVFSEEYKKLCDEFAKRSLSEYAGDKYMIGYFVTNEPEWFFASGVDLAERLLACEGCVASKARFVEFLREKYSLGELNAAWNVALESFDEFLKPRTFARTDAMTADFKAFEKLLVDAYERIVSDALRRVDPDHLNLGMRYSGLSERILSFSHEPFDAFSFNCYGDSPKEAAAMCEKLGKPFLVGEWHIGAIESLLPAYGLRFVDTQKERADACRYYAENGAVEPGLVGMHYFEYNDQPYFGRFDGECYQIGLQDVCHRQYKDVCGMFESFAKKLYALHDGKEIPTADHIPTRTQ